MLHTNRDNISPNPTPDESSNSSNVPRSDSTYSSVLKLIAGSLEGYTDHHNIYSDTGHTRQDSVPDKTLETSQVPTLLEVARKVAQYEGT